VDNQKVYDAMLIKAFRKDAQMKDLELWLKPYNIKLMECGLRRVPKRIWWFERVRVVVRNYMRVLADRLWDTTPDKDIETLAWMQNIDCSKKSKDKVLEERASLRKNSNTNRRRASVLQENWEGQKRTNQWNITK
jgi:hypothetical protein